MQRFLTVGLLVAVSALQPSAQRGRTLAVELWSQGRPAFGVYVPGPYTTETGQALASNPLVDFLFLNLEGGYDPAAVTAIVQGVGAPEYVIRKTVIVRIPPISKEGPDKARARVAEILAAGADGVTIPHVRNVEEAKLAIGFFQDAKKDVWSPSNPKGETIAMLMIEDPAALEQTKEIASLKGYSILACGIGSLRQALGGNREAAEAGTQKVLSETKRTKLVNMLTANASDVEKRVKEGFLALLMQAGPAGEEAIKIGRAAAGR